MKKSRFRQIIRELIEDELKEVSTTGAVAGYETPFAFGNNAKRKKNARQAGYTPVDGAKTEGDNDDVGMVRKKFARMNNERKDESFDASTLGMKWHSVKESQHKKLSYLKRQSRIHKDKSKRLKYEQAARKLERYMNKHKKLLRRGE